MSNDKGLIDPTNKCLVKTDDSSKTEAPVNKLQVPDPGGAIHATLQPAANKDGSIHRFEWEKALSPEDVLGVPSDMKVGLVCEIQTKIVKGGNDCEACRVSKETEKGSCKEDGCGNAVQLKNEVAPAAASVQDGGGNDKSPEECGVSSVSEHLMEYKVRKVQLKETELNKLADFNNVEKTGVKQRTELLVSRTVDNCISAPSSHDMHFNKIEICRGRQAMPETREHVCETLQKCAPVNKSIEDDKAHRTSDDKMDVPCKEHAPVEMIRVIFSTYEMDSKPVRELKGVGSDEGIVPEGLPKNALTVTPEKSAAISLEQLDKPPKDKWFFESSEEDGEVREIFNQGSSPEMPTKPICQNPEIGTQNDIEVQKLIATSSAVSPSNQKQGDDDVPPTTEDGGSYVAASCSICPQCKKPHDDGHILSENWRACLPSILSRPLLMLVNDGDVSSEMKNEGTPSPKSRQSEGSNMKQVDINVDPSKGNEWERSFTSSSTISLSSHHMHFDDNYNHYPTGDEYSWTTSSPNSLQSESPKMKQVDVSADPFIGIEGERLITTSSAVSPLSKMQVDDGDHPCTKEYGASSSVCSQCKKPHDDGHILSENWTECLPSILARPLQMLVNDGDVSPKKKDEGTWMTPAPSSRQSESPKMKPVDVDSSKGKKGERLITTPSVISSSSQKHVDNGDLPSTTVSGGKWTAFSPLYCFPNESLPSRQPGPLPMLVNDGNVPSEKENISGFMTFLPISWQNEIPKINATEVNADPSKGEAGERLIATSSAVSLPSQKPSDADDHPTKMEDGGICFTTSSSVCSHCKKPLDDGHLPSQTDLVGNITTSLPIIGKHEPSKLVDVIDLSPVTAGGRRWVNTSSSVSSPGQKQAGDGFFPFKIEDGGICLTSSTTMLQSEVRKPDDKDDLEPKEWKSKVGKLGDEERSGIKGPDQSKTLGSKSNLLGKDDLNKVENGLRKVNKSPGNLSESSLPSKFNAFGSSTELELYSKSKKKFPSSESKSGKAGQSTENSPRRYPSCNNKIAKNEPTTCSSGLQGKVAMKEVAIKGRGKSGKHVQVKEYVMISSKKGNQELPNLLHEPSGTYRQYVEFTEKELIPNIQATDSKKVSSNALGKPFIKEKREMKLKPLKTEIESPKSRKEGKKPSFNLIKNVLRIRGGKKSTRDGEICSEISGKLISTTKWCETEEMKKETATGGISDRDVGTGDEKTVNNVSTIPQRNDNQILKSHNTPAAANNERNVVECSSTIAGVEVVADDDDATKLAQEHGCEVPPCRVPESAHEEESVAAPDNTKNKAAVPSDQGVTDNVNECKETQESVPDALWVPACGTPGEKDTPSSDKVVDVNDFIGTQKNVPNVPCVAKKKDVPPGYEVGTGNVNDCIGTQKYSHLQGKDAGRAPLRGPASKGTTTPSGSCAIDNPGTDGCEEISSQVPGISYNVGSISTLGPTNNGAAMTGSKDGIVYVPIGTQKVGSVQLSCIAPGMLREVESGPNGGITSKKASKPGGQVPLVINYNAYYSIGAQQYDRNVGNPPNCGSTKKSKVSGKSGKQFASGNVFNPIGTQKPNCESLPSNVASSETQNNVLPDHPRITHDVGRVPIRGTTYKGAAKPVEQCAVGNGSHSVGVQKCNCQIKSKSVQGMSRNVPRTPFRGSTSKVTVDPDGGQWATVEKARKPIKTQKLDHEVKNNKTIGATETPDSKAIASTHKVIAKTNCGSTGIPKNCNDIPADYSPALSQENKGTKHGTIGKVATIPDLYEASKSADSENLQQEMERKAKAPSNTEQFVEDDNAQALFGDFISEGAERLQGPICTLAEGYFDVEKQEDNLVGSRRRTESHQPTNYYSTEKWLRAAVQSPLPKVEEKKDKNQASPGVSIDGLQHDKPNNQEAVLAVVPLKADKQAYGNSKEGENHKISATVGIDGSMSDFSDDDYDDDSSVGSLRADNHTKRQRTVRVPIDGDKADGPSDQEGALGARRTIGSLKIDNPPGQSQDPEACQTDPNQAALGESNVNTLIGIITTITFLLILVIIMLFSSYVIFLGLKESF